MATGDAMKKTALEARIDALAGLHGDGLVSKQETLLARVSPEDHRMFLREAGAAAVTTWAELVTAVNGAAKPSKDPRGEASRRVALYRTTHDEVVVARAELTETLMALRYALTVRVPAETLLALLEELPSDPVLPSSLWETIGQARRALALSTMPRREEAPENSLEERLVRLARDVAKYDGWPGELAFQRGDMVPRLAAMGVTWGPEIDPAEHPRVHRQGAYWTTDPDRKFVPRASVAWALLSRAQFPARLYTGRVRASHEDAPLTIELRPAAEWFDTVVDRKRVVLAPLAYARETQVFYALDMLAPESATRALYSIDHDGTGAARAPYLLEAFLQRLAPVAE